ncbi:MAG TPA: outer membrane protein transport protein [Polyangiaceae bacterium]
MRTHFGFGLGLALAGLFTAGGASATNILETGDNGSEQMARGGAWVARASDPLATFYNPAGLAGQDTKVTLQLNLNIQNTCFTRYKAPNDGTTGDAPPGGTQDYVNAGSYFPKVCNDGAPFPNPQIAVNYKVNERLGIGFVILGPSAAGQQNWPDTVNGAPAPSRYLLLSANTLLLTPTIGVGWEPIDRLRIGASFIWGIADFDFATMGWALNSGYVGPDGKPYTTAANGIISPAVADNDIRGELKMKQMFIPGFSLGTIWSPSDYVDLSGWYKYMSSVDAQGDVTTRFGTKNPKITDTSQSNCGNDNAGQNAHCAPGDVHFRIALPMEAKVGVRVHVPRANANLAHKRDPMSQDVFDVEADFTWANNSAFDAIHIGFPGTAADGTGTIPVAGTGIGKLPQDGSVPHYFKDVFGVRLGGDYNVIPDFFALRAGAYFETKAQDSQYQNIDFAGQQRFGIAGGAAMRVHLGSGEKKQALEFMLGLGHTFIATSNYTGPGGVYALSGVPCDVAVPGNAGTPTGATCNSGAPKLRSEFPVNLGTITNAFTQINVGASYRF